jgi:hypothetical protein
VRRVKEFNGSYTLLTSESYVIGIERWPACRRISHATLLPCLSAEQLVTHNADVTDRMIEKRNLADLLKRFSHSGSPAPRDRLRAVLQRY